MYDLFLAGLRFVFVLILYLFLAHVIRLMYLERKRAGKGVLKGRQMVLVAVETKNGGIKKGEKYILGENISIGRDRNNDIAIDDNHISTRHAVIKRLDGEWQLRDLGSTNGTYINNMRVEGMHNLRPGDRISIGGVTFKVGWEDAWRGHFPYRTGTAR